MKNSSIKKSILREKCTILEQQYKINRRLSPRKLISVGKSVEPPPMAPSETYVSTYESEISESQLKVRILEIKVLMILKFRNILLHYRFEL